MEEDSVGAARSEQMRRIHSKDTKPELLVRRAVFRLGYRYRLHARELPGQPDLVFPSRRKVIFIHGCFWHRHPGCRKTRLPKSNLEYWEDKFAANVARDQRDQAALRAAGWSVLIVWECELAHLDATLVRIKEFLEE